MKLFLKTKGRFASSFTVGFIVNIIMLAIIGYSSMIDKVIKYPAIIYTGDSNEIVFTLSRLVNWMWVIVGGFTFLSILTIFVLGKYSYSKEE